MQLRTVAALVGLGALLGGVVVVGLSIVPSGGGSLSEAWVSETPRDNEVNHHAVGVDPAGDVIVAPVAEVPYADAPITNESCTLARLDPADGAVVWRTGMPAEDCFTHALTEPAVADVDGDGRPEVAVASTEEALVVHDARTGAEEWRVGLSAYGYGRPTVANLSADASPEVVTSDIEGGVVAVRGDGTVAWRFAADERLDRPTVSDAPRVDDFDADGRPEVLVGSSSGSVLLSHEGEVQWVDDGEATYVASGQIDADPALELFAAGTGTVRAHDGASGETEWTRSIPIGRIRTATDGDGDGVVELYVGTADGDVLALDGASGETEWTTTLSTGDVQMTPPPVVGDVTGDGRPEVVAVTNAGTVAVLDAASGDELARYERDVRIWTFATPADIDDDGRAEVLVRYGDGRVVALEYAR